MSAFLILIRYTAPLEEVDTLMGPHVTWLKQQYRAGHFFAWGRKRPRDGGVILAQGRSREEIAALAATDPFVTGGVAETEIVEWTPSFTAEGFEGLKA